MATKSTETKAVPLEQVKYLVMRRFAGGTTHPILSTQKSLERVLRTEALALKRLPTLEGVGVYLLCSEQCVANRVRWEQVWRYPLTGTLAKTLEYCEP